jgi:hypothetical protein
MGRLLVRRKRSESSSSLLMPSDQSLRGEKSTPYANPSYKTLIEIERNIYMRDEDKSPWQRLVDR